MKHNNTMLNLIQINPLISSSWGEALSNNPNPQFFHHSFWLKTLIDTYRFKPLCFMIQSDKGYTIPFLVVTTLKGKKKAVALPFSDGCDIQCGNIRHDELVATLLSIAKQEKLDRLDFKGTSSFQPSFEPSHSYYGHKLQLTKDEKKLWKNLASSKQRNIKKAQREIITVTFNNNLQSMREYYRLHCITRKRHGLPPQPVRFFDAIHENIISKGYGEVALGYAEKSAIAGAIYLFSGSEVLYKFGASDKNLQHMRVNDLLMWDAINRYAQKGFKTFSFGKTEKFHEGLCRFKEGFGAERVVMDDYCYDVLTGNLIKDAPSVHGIHNKIFRRMPVPLLKLCGEILYRFNA